MSSSSLFDPSKEFVGRRVLVTGGSRGIGAGIAQRLLQAGASVVVTARSKIDGIPASATFIAGDVSTDAGVAAIAKSALTALGGLDILVNNAGAVRSYPQGSITIPDEEWLDAVNMNYLAAVRMIRAVMPALQESKAAAIINISAGSATPAFPALVHYLAAKAALNTYSKALARELAPLRIRVNTVTPGHVLTPGADKVRQDLADAMNVPVAGLFAQIPLGQPGEPKEVAEVVALLASDRGHWITGQNWHVDGGMSM